MKKFILILSVLLITALFIQANEVPDEKMKQIFNDNFINIYIAGTPLGTALGAVSIFLWRRVYPETAGFQSCLEA